MDNRKDVTMIPKFRVWDKNVKVLRPVDFIDLQKQIVTYHISDLTISAIHLKNIVLMQSTGMQDKNGVEIYEGDIVKVETMGGVVYGYAKYKSFSFMICSEDMDMIMLVGWDYEILGNIYENPELIEEK